MGNKNSRKVKDAEPSKAASTAEKLQNSNNSVQMIRLLMVGDHDVGKTSLVRRYCEDSFSMEKPPSSSRLDFRIKNLTIGATKVRLQLWDIESGSSEMLWLVRSYYRGAMGVLFVFDLTNLKSFLGLRKWMQDVDAYADKSINRILIGNKSDFKAKGEIVPIETAKAFAKEYSLKFFEVSARQDINVEVSFITIMKDILERLVGTKENPAKSDGKSVVRPPSATSKATKEEKVSIYQSPVYEKKPALDPNHQVPPPASQDTNLLQFITKRQANKKFSPDGWIVKPKKKCAIFVSSTFTDTFLERAILQEKILPILQHKAAEHNILFMIYDMRFGIKDESSRDHTTWQCCFDAIRECFEESERNFFLSLQGNKYGYRPLPKLIDRQYFEEIEQQFSENSEWIQLSKHWYRLNTNLLPPCYELRDLQTNDNKEYWNHVLPHLRDHFLNGHAFDRQFPEFKVNASITEWETKLAERLGYERFGENAQVGLWMKREFELESLLDPELPGNPVDFADCLHDVAIKEKLDELKQRMSCNFEVTETTDPKQKFPVKEYVSQGQECLDYLARWEVIVKDRLQQEIEKCIELNTSWKEDVQQQYGLPIDYLEEIFHHNQLTKVKAATFIGRESLVTEAMNMMVHNPTTSQQTSAYSMITMAVIGPSGAGKTALMSKMAMLVSTTATTTTITTTTGTSGAITLEGRYIPVIVRYCGTSKFSLRGKDLIQSISLQVLSSYDDLEEITRFLQIMSDQTYLEAVDYFQELIRRYPVIIFIDSVDQLSNQDEARSKLSFLRNLKHQRRPSCMSKIILSTLPDEYDSQKQSWKYRYVCENILRNNQIPLLDMKEYSISDSDIRTVLQTLLARRARQLTSNQWEIVLQAAALEPSMLYLNLSLEIASKWKSWETDVHLQPTVKRLVQQIFEELERQYGKALISYSFGLITFARDGINDQEIIDCLTQQPEVFTEVCQYWQDVDRIPLHVWIRVKLAIKALLAEKELACIKWYHRQLQEAAEERYQHVKTNCHLLMGKYFCQRPLCLTAEAVWHPAAKINRRRVREGYFHLLEAYHCTSNDETITELCSFEMVCAAALNHDVFHLLSSLAKLRNANASTTKNNNIERVEHYYRWIRRTINVIERNPRLYVPVTASEEPSLSQVQQDSLQRYRNSSNINLQDSMVSVLSLTGKSQFGSMIASLENLTGFVQAIAWSHDGTRIAAGSVDCNVTIWDFATGELQTTLEGHASAVTSVSWSPNNRQIASGSRDKTIKIWEVETGELVKTFTVWHERGVTSLSWDGNGSRILSGSDDMTVKLWSVHTGDLVFALTGHEKTVTTVAWNQDESKIASGAWDAKIKIWDVVSAKILITLEGSEGILSVAWNPKNDDQLIAGSYDGMIKLWNTTTGRLLQTFTGHSKAVVSISWDPSGITFVSGSHDHTIKIWSVMTKTLVTTFSGEHFSEITAVAWHPMEKILLSASKDKTIKIWDTSLIDRKPLSTITMGHQDRVTSVSWNLEGTRMISGSSDHSIKIWDVLTGELLQTLLGHTKGVTAVSFDATTNRIVSGSLDETVKIWEMTSGQALLTFTGLDKPVLSISWNPHGTKIVAGSVGKVLIWNCLTRELERELPGPRNDTQVSWNPNGDTIATVGDYYRICLWSTDSGELLQTLEGHLSSVSALAWSFDGKRLASGSNDHMIKIWNTQTGELLNSFFGHDCNQLSIAWDPTGTFLVSSAVSISRMGRKWFDTTMKIWEATTGEVVSQWEAHSAGVTAVAWSSDGTKIASASEDTMIKIWNADSVLKAFHHVIEKRRDMVTSLAWNEDSTKIASGSYDKTIKIWSVASGQLLQVFRGHLHMVSSVAWSVEGKVIASGSYDRTIKLWNAKSGELFKTLEGHTGLVVSVALHPDSSKVISGSYDRTVKVWSVTTGELLLTFTEPKTFVRTVAWHPNGITIAGGTADTFIYLWNTMTGILEKTFEGHKDVTSVAFSLDGSKMVSASKSNTVRLWKVTTSELLACYDNADFRGGIRSISWHHEGNQIAFPCQNEIYLWDITTGTQQSVLKNERSCITSVVWSPNGKMIASASSGTLCGWGEPDLKYKAIKVWDCKTEKVVCSMKGENC